MSRQGENAGGSDWWGRLYDEDAPDTGRAPADDSVDERFDSAAGTVGVGRSPAPAPREAAGTAEAPAGPEPSGGTEPPAAPAVPVPDFVGDRPPGYESEPTALPAADPDELADLTPDTVLEGARYGSFTLRAVSLRGDSSRYRGEPRRDALLTARFGSGEDALVLVAVAAGARTAIEAHRAAREICRWVGSAVGHSHARLAEDIRAARRGDLKSGLHRLMGRGYGRLRARAAELGLEAEEYTADLRCLLLSADPECRVRVFFGVGDGGLFRLRDGTWQDIDPGGRGTGAERGTRPEESGGGLVPDPGPAPAMPGPFRFRASVARPGDTLLLCSAGLAGPMRDERAFADRLAERWVDREPPGLAAFLVDARLRVEGHADDRTAAAVWEH
ncbi:protein phosphatase 2C domain-containing protein [Streptomyces macrosporus]|uniref:PPM-type phosphatase domain-containing protein n=1 Tax=Streptomyces macrosporus TaxID=44032 RepID=A0ABN3K5J4_9ACTN